MRDLGVKIDFLKQQRQQQQSGNLSEGVSEAVAGQRIPALAGSKVVDNVFSMADGSGVSKAWDGALSVDELTAASMQDVFDMAFAVDEWSNLDSLWPGMDQMMPEQYVLG
jgi:hypothetical protein